MQIKVVAWVSGVSVVIWRGSSADARHAARTIRLFQQNINLSAVVVKRSPHCWLKLLNAEGVLV